MCLTEYQAMDICVWRGDIAPTILNLGINLSASPTVCCTAEERDPVTTE
jgi:hypothetical protein